MREIDTLIIHCSYTPPDMDIGAAEINDWHLERGWDGIGYHLVIRRSGELEEGRDIEKAGAHARGHNRSSIGLCLVGGMSRDHQPDCNFTRMQWSCLSAVVDSLVEEYGPLKVIGHRDVDSGKECPCFDVGAWHNGMV